MNVVELKNISKNFNKLSVLKDIDVDLAQGEVLGLFGHNGAGKTTMMKIILGLLKPDSGGVRVFGQNPYLSNFNHYRYQLGFLPENLSFYQQLSGMEVLQFFAKLKRVSTDRCMELILQVGLWEARFRKVKNYSKGMKQRLGLAQALLTEPSLLLLDEPTVGLDPMATQEFYQIVERLRSNGCSIILCSHILAGIEKHIDKAAILSQGRLQAYGSIESLRKQTSLETLIIFSGCFEIDDLSNRLGKAINTTDDGNFILKVNSQEKLKILQVLMSQPGIQDLDTRPAGLEQIYRYFVEKDHQVVDFPTLSKLQQITQNEVQS